MAQADAKHGSLPRSKVTAALMISRGENLTCSFGNINDATVVTVGANTTSRYIGQIFGCVVLPMTLPVGTQVSVSGVIQDTNAVPNLSSNASTTIDEACFNVEGFSLGLTSDSGSEFDPNDPANIVNAQGFGFMWYDSDSDLKPGPYTYTVTGCSGGCAIGTNYYNTDGGSGSQACTVLAPFPEVAQQASHHR